MGRLLHFDLIFLLQVAGIGYACGWVWGKFLLFGVLFFRGRVILTGRPKKYNKISFEKKAAAYFKSISRTVTVTENKPTGRFDGYGHVIYEAVPILNDAGEPIRRLEYVIPPSIGGLCEFLGIHRSTWADYSDAQKHPEFSDTVAHVQGRIRAWNEEQLVTRRDVRGIIFNLQNNYGYSEKRELEVSGNGSGKFSLAYETPLDEKMRIIDELFKSASSDSHENTGSIEEKNE